MEEGSLHHIMKSPLKSKPLRNPGQSVDERIHDFITEDTLPYMIVAAACVLLVVMEWYRWATNSPPFPVPLTVIAVFVLLYTGIKVVIAMKKIRALRLGRDGEKAIGQYLELLSANGVKVFHDIPGEGFNLDHVVIDKSGIYVIETKAFSKPEKGKTIVTYGGERVFNNGKEPDRNPVI